MTKIHISLVGKQPEPVLNGINYSKPEKVFLIHSLESVEVANKIKSECGLPCELKGFDPTDLSMIYSRINDLKRVFDDEEDSLSINLVGGTKHWSLAFFDAFQHYPNVEMYLIDQNHVVTQLNTHAVENVSFDMDSVFRLNGNPLEESNYTPFFDYDEEDLEVMRKVESVRFYHPFFDLAVKIPADLKAKLDNQPNGHYELKDGSVDWSKPGFVRMSLRKNQQEGFKDVEFSSPHAVKLVFNSGWFEYKVSRMVAHWKRSSDVRLNCLFPPKVVNGNEKVKNEVDVIANIGTKILFVECKTKLTNSTDIDKFRTAVSNYGGDASKALLVSYDPLTDLQKEKCKESGILFFSVKGNQNPEQALFLLLEKEYNRINA